MRFPSIDALFQRARTVLVRFPWPLLAGAVAATAAIIATNAQAYDEELWARFCLVAMLGIPLTFGISLLAEWRRWSSLLRTGVLLAGVVLLYWFFWTWPGPEQKHLVIRYLQLSAAIHLAVAFLPFWGRREGLGFWQYNRRLFEGFLRAVLFSGVLFVGLAIALAALDKLFGVDIEEETYARLWFIMAFVANTWIFLAGVPDELEPLEESASYPRALKVFTQYILTPLVAIYLVILLAYLVKIIVTGSWPSGWIGYLVSSVGAVGILGFLLVHPLRLNEDEGWIRTFSRWLFIGLMPAAVMFLLALWKRVGPYGLTELRFLGFLLGGWLLGIALLYTVRRESGIRIIPVSLAFILLITAFGPLGATSMSIRSQAHRIREIMNRYAVLSAESASDQSAMQREDRQQMSEALRFLLERNARGTVRELFPVDERVLADLDPDYYGQVDSVARTVMRSIGQEYLTQYEYQPADYFAVERQGNGEALGIRGFEYTVSLNGNDSALIYVGADTFQVVTDGSRMRVDLRRIGADTLLTFDLKPLVDTLFALDPAARNAIAKELAADKDGVRGMLALAWLSAERRDGVVKLTAWRGELYLTLVEHPDAANVPARFEPGRQPRVHDGKNLALRDEPFAQ